MRADIAIKSHADFERRARRHRPSHHRAYAYRVAGLYINRAFLRYNLDSYNGAMADYDYALSLEPPYNAVALFNRGACFGRGQRQRPRP